MAAIVGTSGDDRIFNAQDTATITALDGDDLVFLWNPGPQDIQVDVGAGDDQIHLQFPGFFPQMTVTLTLGAGRDVVRIYELEPEQTEPITITDFQAGVGGDRIDMRDLLANHRYDVWDFRTNPFAGPEPFFRLVQVGNDVLLQFDEKRPWPPGGWRDFVLFENTQLGDFTADNFFGAPPNGSAVVNQTIHGTAAKDDLTDGYGDDHLFGDVGDDILRSGVGDDTLEGGDGDDWLLGDVAGDDTFLGGAGSDLIQVVQQSMITLPVEVVGHADGGEGNDLIIYATRFDYVTKLVAKGGAGEDDIGVYGVSDATINGGSGRDVIFVDPNASGAITLGSGRDVMEIHRYANQADIASTVHITDFVAGMDGDRLDLTREFVFDNWDGQSDLIAAGYLKFEEVGDSTLIRIASAGGKDWRTTIILDHVPLASLTAYNLSGLSVTGAGLNVQSTAGMTFQGGGAADLILSSQYYSSDIHGNGGDDRIEGYYATDVLHGDAGNDVLIGMAGADTLFGDGGNDVLDGGTGDDALTGGDGDDVLDGGPGVNRLDGGGGFDTVSFEDVSNGVVANLDTLYGDIGDTLLSIEALIGSAHDDILIGDAQANRLRGGAGDDVINGAAGDDLLEGGDKEDMLYGGLGSDTLKGGLGDDTLLGQAGVDVLYGDAGNDLLNGGAEADTLQGGDGNDILVGELGGDLLYGQLGDDTVYGQDGDDTIAGGEGLDVLDGGIGVDLIMGGAGNDILVGRDGDDVMNGDADNDVLIGEHGADLLYGSGGDDFLVGGAGGDTLIGDDGADTGYGGLGDDTLVGGAGGDLLSGEDGADVVAGGIGGDLLVGGSGIDALLGEDGDDTLVGGDGADTLMGGAGNDILIGDQGGDALAGGAGSDIFLFRAVGDSATNPALGQAVDLIVDFQAGLDHIDLRQIDAAAGGGDDAFTLVGGFTRVAGQAVLTYLADGDRTIFQGDVNGDGVADIVLAVNGHLTEASGWLL